MSCGRAPFTFQEPHVSPSPPRGSKLKASDATAGDVHKDDVVDAPSSSSIIVKSYEKTRLSKGAKGHTEKEKPGNQENISETDSTGNIETADERGDENKDVHELRPANSGDELSILPDELILRIISLAGGPTHQMRAAFALGNTCRRLRRVLLTAYLPSLHRFTQDTLNALGLSDARRATQALSTVLTRTCSIRSVSVRPAPQVFTSGCFLALATAATTSLRVVNLAYSCLTDDSVRPLLANCTALENLSLYSCSNMTGEAFTATGRHLRAPIKTLDLSYMHRLDTQSLKAVANIESIAEIKLAGCSNVNNNALTSLAEGNVRHSLQNINLKCCPVDDESIIAFVLRCKKLKRIVLAKHHDNLWETGYYTEAAVMFLRERLPAVQVVIEN